jgi:hypothetical protein
MFSIRHILNTRSAAFEYNSRGAAAAATLQ